jgi:hypothetical protein
VLGPVAWPVVDAGHIETCPRSPGRQSHTPGMVVATRVPVVGLLLHPRARRPRRVERVESAPVASGKAEIPSRGPARRRPRRGVGSRRHSWPWGRTKRVPCPRSGLGRDITSFLLVGPGLMFAVFMPYRGPYYLSPTQSYNDKLPVLNAINPTRIN